VAAVERLGSRVQPPSRRTGRRLCAMGRGQFPV
jgi:hypothetical protein